jgi:hypothetical protein
VVHWVLHQFLKSRFALLRAVGHLHQVHHDFWTRELTFERRLTAQNLLLHRLPEYLTQVAVTAAGLLVVEPAVVVALLGVLTVVFLACVAMGGRDWNHQEMQVVGAPLTTPYVGLDYHALHHAHPEHFMASFVTLFDVLFGTALPLEGRRVLMTGATGALGAPLKALLEEAGAVVRTARSGRDFGPGDYGRLDAALAEADVLVLAHGAKEGTPAEVMEANCTSFLALTERFRHLTRHRRLPPEVWAVGSEIECHPSFGSPTLAAYKASKVAWARHARRLFWERDLLYRHVVPSAFSSRMGPGLMSGRAAARVTLALVRRGFRYVPVSYTGVAWVNALKFLFRVNAAPPRPALRTGLPAAAPAGGPAPAADAAAA